jgi:hypothetical protein
MGSGNGKPAGQRTAAGPGFVRRRWAVLLTCVGIAAALAAEATLTQDRIYTATARVSPPADVDPAAVERLTARRVGWTAAEVAGATELRLAGRAVEARSTTLDRRLATPLADALAREYVAAAERSAPRGMTGAAPRVVAPAGPAVVASEPPVARNAALGAAAGLLLGLLFALALDVRAGRRAPRTDTGPAASEDLLAEIIGDGADGAVDERGDREMARFVALNMVLDGADRDEVRRHIDEHFAVPRKEELVEEAYRRAER